jgi:hypothetical protein
LGRGRYCLGARRYLKPWCEVRANDMSRTVASTLGAEGRRFHLSVISGRSGCTAITMRIDDIVIQQRRILRRIWRTMEWSGVPVRLVGPGRHRSFPIAFATSAKSEICSELALFHPPPYVIIPGPRDLASSRDLPNNCWVSQRLGDLA